MSTIEKNNAQTLEDRLQPWLDQAEYLIVFVIGVMAASAMGINFVGFIVAQNEAVGEIPQLAVAGLVLTIILFGLMLYPIISLEGLERAKRLLGFIQRNWSIVILVFVIFGIIFISLDNRSIWSPYPLVQVCILLLTALFTIVVLFMQPSKDAPFQAWRKIGIGILVAVIAAEIVLQGLVIASIIKVDVDTGVGITYGRVATQDETVLMSQSNQYGWHYVDYRLNDDENHILMLGDTFVQALQVPAEDHMGQQLEQLINADEPNVISEVMAQGFPGYGAGMYLNDNLSRYIWQPLTPDEVIIFFHLVNDFQIETATDGQIAVSVLTDDALNRAVIDADIWRPYHNASHKIIAGHDPLNPFDIIMSYSMLWNLYWTPQGGRLPNQDLTMNTASQDEPFGAATILYTIGDQGDVVSNTYTITEAVLADYVDAMTAIDTNVRLVTIPYFPAEFYADNSGTDWDVAFGDYDLSLTERAMRDMAADLNIEFLGMLNYLQGTDIDTLQSYFFNDGTGHLTSEGHQAFAEALMACFYTETADSRCAVEE